MLASETKWIISLAGQLSPVNLKLFNVRFHAHVMMPTLL